MDPTAKVTVGAWVASTSGEVDPAPPPQDETTEDVINTGISFLNIIIPFPDFIHKRITQLKVSQAHIKVRIKFVKN